MNLIESVKNDIKSAMINKEKDRLSTLRMLLSGLEKKGIAKKIKLDDLSDSEVVAVVKSNLKALDQEIESLSKANRDASKQELEKETLQKYLPKQLSEGEITDVVDNILDYLNDMGSEFTYGMVMKEATAQMKNNADMSLVSKIVKKQFEKSKGE